MISIIILEGCVYNLAYIDRGGLINIKLIDGTEHLISKGLTLEEIKEFLNIESRYKIVAAKVNNVIRELTWTPESDCVIEFIDISHEDGLRIYRRSLHFILIKAVEELFPGREVVISHTISKGIYIEINGNKELNENEVYQIECRMREIVSRKTPFIKHVLPLEEAKKIFASNGRENRLKIVEQRGEKLVTVYSCDGFYDYFYGYMVPHTGYADIFKLIYYKPGLVMIYPMRENPDKLPVFEEKKKLFSIFMEYKKWGRIIGVETVACLNERIKKGKAKELVMVSEALQEKKIAQIADMITHSHHKKRVVLISGPSSSGKTTFAKRLSVQLRVNGINPQTISLDDYFVNREFTPRDEKGDYDFEALEAVDVKLFNEHLGKLVQGFEVEVPIYNFYTGSREPKGRMLRIEEDDVLIIEGIHGLNPKLTMSIPKKNKFQIYVSALTSLSIDEHNRIPTTDTRLLRRIVRDNQFRGVNALKTLKMWPSVRRGEEKNIFPFQEEADIMFNSSLLYELCVLKSFALPLLKEIDSSCAEYSEAKRLIKFLSYFFDIDDRFVPQNSIIREFIGGSIFY